ncbi:MAG: nucleotidyltransferase family protein, partial [Clostridia bacterium]|nr:nucleotidyltransferase family protein [Clostridia bacterium]
MKTAAIICEFNPFHNGHKYLIEQAKLSNDAVVCIMSGSFVQRGDIAIFDKWTRTHQALLSGADLVVELPVCFSLNSAERFAYGSVCLADSMNVIDT